MPSLGHEPPGSWTTRPQKICDNGWSLNLKPVPCWVQGLRYRDIGRTKNNTGKGVSAVLANRTHGRLHVPGTKRLGRGQGTVTLQAMGILVLLAWLTGVTT